MSKNKGSIEILNLVKTALVSLSLLVTSGVYKITGGNVLGIKVANNYETGTRIAVVWEDPEYTANDEAAQAAAREAAARAAQAAAQAAAREAAARAAQAAAQAAAALTANDSVNAPTNYEKSQSYCSAKKTSPISCPCGCTPSVGGGFCTKCSTDTSGDIKIDTNTGKAYKVENGQIIYIAETVFAKLGQSSSTMVCPAGYEDSTTTVGVRYCKLNKEKIVVNPVANSSGAEVQKAMELKLNPVVPYESYSSAVNKAVTEEARNIQQYGESFQSALKRAQTGEEYIPQPYESYSSAVNKAVTEEARNIQQYGESFQSALKRAQTGEEYIPQPYESYSSAVNKAVTEEARNIQQYGESFQSALKRAQTGEEYIPVVDTQKYAQTVYNSTIGSYVVTNPNASPDELTIKSELINCNRFTGKDKEDCETGVKNDWKGGNGAKEIGSSLIPNQEGASAVLVPKDQGPQPYQDLTSGVWMNKPKIAINPYDVNEYFTAGLDTGDPKLNAVLTSGFLTLAAAIVAAPQIITYSGMAAASPVAQASLVGGLLGTTGLTMSAWYSVEDTPIVININPNSSLTGNNRLNSQDPRVILPKAPIDVADQIAVKNKEGKGAIYEAASIYLANNNDEAAKVVRKLDYLPNNSWESPSNACGPISAAILKDVKILPEDTNISEFYRLDAKREPDKKILEKYFPKDNFTYTTIKEPTSKVDYKNNPLKAGDWIYIFGSDKDTFEHMVVVTRVDEQGSAYTVANEKINKTDFAIKEVKLYDPSNNTGALYDWNNAALRKDLGTTGRAGMLIIRQK